MQLLRVDIDARTGTECLLLRALVFRVRDGQLAVEDEVRGQAAVGVWWVVGISISTVLDLACGKGR